MPSNIRTHLKDHLSLYVFVSMLFVTGVIFGVMMVSALTLEQKQELARHMGNYFHVVDQGELMPGKQSFPQTLSLNLKWLVIIWVLGISVIGLPVILALDFLKGVLIGFSFAFLVEEFSWKGMFFGLTSIAPRNIILIPVIITASVLALAFSFSLVKNRLAQRKGKLYSQFIAYSTTNFLLALIVTLVSLFEAFFVPTMMQWVTPHLVAIVTAFPLS
ncbi:stage II sporulation protein M [Paenibacillus senegalensis]|uniref:stage II sporulation protein M n=1 Tax=Paenibacillus senegalensis TaxID=1465766 RepID=UPI000287F844|nr:stage II sporulation protein M [Paenibacillus senegalensis]